MKVIDLYYLCFQLVEQDKGHYDVCLVDREDYEIYRDIQKYYVLDEDDETLGTLILND